MARPFHHTACAVAVCNSPKGNVFYHRFPKDEALRSRWLAACRRADTFDWRTTRVCSQHFEDEDYETDLRNELLNLPLRKILKPGAVPSKGTKPEIVASASTTSMALGFSVNQLTADSITSQVTSRILRKRRRDQKKEVESILQCYEETKDVGVQKDDPEGKEMHSASQFQMLHNFFFFFRVLKSARRLYRLQKRVKMWTTFLHQPLFFQLSRFPKMLRVIRTILLFLMMRQLKSQFSSLSLMHLMRKPLRKKSLLKMKKEKMSSQNRPVHPLTVENRHWDK